MEGGCFWRSFAAQTQEGCLAEALGRLGMAPAFLHHHDVKRLVDIDSELDRAGADIKLPAGSLE